MNWIKKIRAFFPKFRSKYKVSLRDPHNFREVWYIYLSPLNVFTVLVAVILLIFTLAVTVLAWTPILDYMPGKAGYRSRTLLIQSNIRLDSLEHQLALQNNYYNNLVRIMDGQPPVSMDELTARDTVRAAATDIPRIPEDSVLRRQMEEAGPYRLQSGAASRNEGKYTDLFPPTAGVILSKFNPREGRLGVDIAAAENQPVMSIMEGTVIASSWSPTEGNLIYILHPGNLISAYLNNARLTKKAGEKVYSGEVIAFTGASTARGDDQGHIQFQLWINGTPVDPENYILF
jgi:murein DD-endopeptidase MepM/ murein hydrolase activator NlpD